jgi:hypothetical protein
MNITVINGTEQKGCTFAMKEASVAAMGGGGCIRVSRGNIVDGRVQIESGALFGHESMIVKLNN